MIRFSSEASGDISMLDRHAFELLRLLGHSEARRGALTAEQIPAALAALRAALQEAAPRPEQRGPESRDAAAPTAQDDEDEERAQPVDLRRRAFPLMEMLELAARRKVPVVWGV